MKALDLNTINFFFLMLAMLLHWRIRSFLKAVVASVSATAGVLIQFPFYGGILVLITKSGISDLLAKLFVSLSTPDSFPVLVGAYSALLGLFVPSAGGKWLIEAPVRPALPRIFIMSTSDGSCRSITHPRPCRT